MPLLTRETVFEDDGYPRYEQIARAIADAIGNGQLRPGERLPTVRHLASELGVSMTTANAAFSLLADRGLIRGEIGRGTFVAKRPSSDIVDEVRLPRYVGGHLRRSGKVPWRRRALTNSAARLRARYPNAIDCSTGRPDPDLLPLELIRRHWAEALSHVTSRDLQYATAEPIDELGVLIASRLNADAIPVRGSDLVIGASAQQFTALAMDIVAGLWGPEGATVAVEQPGYPTVLDTWERAGARLIGVAVDEEGVVPESLATALEGKAKAALFTPRAHNPTGASWSRRRVRALADVLHAHPDVIAIEDDQFGGIAEERPGSLLGDARVEDRVLYIRSFSKSIAPDLRVAVAAARPRLRNLILEAKCFADGWTSRLVQRVLARILSDPELDTCLERARLEYRFRRTTAADIINGWPGYDGVNLWVHLPSGVDATEVIEHAASSGVLVAPGEPFFVSPGHSDVVRFNAGSVGTDRVAACALKLVDSISKSGRSTANPIHV